MNILPRTLFALFVFTGFTMASSLALGEAPVFGGDNLQSQIISNSMDPNNQASQAYVSAEGTTYTANNTTTNTTTSNGSSETLNKLNDIEALKQQIRELRGQIELQSHKIEQLQMLQRTQFSDINNRLNMVEGGKHAPSSGVNMFPKTAQQLNPTPATGPINPTEAKNVVNEQHAYEQAYDLLRNKQYSQANSALRSYLQSYPNGHYAVNAHYWLGELSLISGNDEQAKVEFNTVVQNYPDSAKVPDAMLKLGFIYYHQQQWAMAKKELKSVSNKYPNSSAAHLAAQRLQLMREQGH